MDKAAQINAAIRVIRDVSETIRELKEVPSGHLYARLMGILTLEQYEQVLDILKGAKLIQVDGSHLIRWAGPEI